MFNDDDMMIIKDVRVSFPHLFTRPMINGEEGTYGAQLMLDPEIHKAEIDAIEARIDELRKEKLKGARLPSDKLCLREGEDKGRPEYEGLMILSANNEQQPVVLDHRAKKVESEAKSDIYAGCYVNAKISLWAQNNQYGKRVNANLIAVQFAGDGESLDGTYVSEDAAVDGFGEVEPDDDFLAKAS